MSNFRLANDRTNYSEAFRFYRKQVMERYFGFLMAAVVILIIYVLFFATSKKSDQTSSKQSIIDMPTAQFVKDEAGNTELKMMKYLDTFPFRYYLIVQNIQELPNVLAGALRQWFAEVVESTA